jgi:hypothetical protein
LAEQYFRTSQEKEHKKKYLKKLWRSQNMLAQSDAHSVWECIPCLQATVQIQITLSPPKQHVR